MEIMQVLHMNGGMGETSYANNSLLQRKVISMTKPITEATVRALFSTVRHLPGSLAIADLGCSSGPNTLFAISEIITIMIDLCEATNHELPEFQVFLNDLPGNDFNTIFGSLLPRFKEKLSEQMKSKYGASATLPCFFNGVPGSFYGRLFAQESLHLIHSSYSLMWLSQVPPGLEGNKGNIYMARSSPPKVLRAYYEQFQRDFSTFLECRGQELVVGGRMVLTLLGRRSDDPSSKECCYIWELLAIALNEMVSEGLIEEEKLDSFNIPQYTPSPKEVRLEVQKQGSFSIDCLEVSEVNWNVFDTDFDPNVVSKDGEYNLARCMRAVAEPLLIDHFGEEIMDELFKRYKAQLAACMSKEKPAFVNVIISLKKIT
ncbi:LOW QUALITY PROTEIN: S-adenosyl-L-methionine:benzoic acid/salicylic acid carboxyl methyltransferase 3 [Eucalyptus grandis]|uniref:LOW QUALITY PROTEIN: S-adenosyl-L-methionine:benzoic acid/salicylic acid carboxyl methyltransferase 3 n=1 Tax=Eucalyptus grandis TaxID=71139 RepID=UPI00192EF85B|nr:LOW QUALITY PROTEIN: S-adenosyl-L-methionine:benzoic acid/salicylic acid carboxyl methyltransferase 3 [Eucalyptus grandis]